MIIPLAHSAVSYLRRFQPGGASTVAIAAASGEQPRHHVCGLCPPLAAYLGKATGETVTLPQEAGLTPKDFHAFRQS